MVGEEDIYGKLIASDDEHASVGWEPAVISSQFGSNSISFIQQRLLGLEQMLVALLLQSSRLSGTGGQAVNDRPHALADESLQPTDVRAAPGARRDAAPAPALSRRAADRQAADRQLPLLPHLPRAG